MLTCVTSEFLNQRKELKIRRRQSIGGQFFGPHPPEIIATEGRWCAGQPRTIKQVKGDGLGVIVVTDLNKLRKGLHVHAQFFPDLPFKTHLQGLAGFLLSARKFPVPRKMAALGSLRDEELPVLPDQACGDMKVSLSHCYCPTCQPREQSHHRGTEDTEKNFCLSGDTDKQK
jgi:hypothetical protein